jgi:hypothetical protein
MPFCHGDRGAVLLGSIFRTRAVADMTSPYLMPRPRMMYLY